MRTASWSPSIAGSGRFMTADLVFVVNPASGNGRTGRHWRVHEAYFRRHLKEAFEVRLTERTGHATELVKDALVQGASTVVSVGGDGTLNEVANGYLDGTGRPWNPDAALAVFPLGTGSDFARTTGHSREPADLVRRLEKREVRAIDAGLVEYGSGGVPRSRYFVNEGEFGSAAAVSDRVNRSTKIFGGKVSFLIGVLRTLPKYRNTRVAIEVDGGPRQELVVNNLTAANGRFYGGGLQPAPHADLSDGLFDVIVFGDIDFKHQRKSLGLLREGKHLGLPGISWFRAKEVRVEAGNELIDVEGEVIGRRPQRFAILPGAVRFLF